MLSIALIYKKEMQFNVLPLRGKVPTAKWDIWQEQIQSESDVEAMNWNGATGVGVIMGINNLRCIDIDKIENPEVVRIILSELNLPNNYRWVVQSGSGAGAHIYFYCSDTNGTDDSEGSESNVNGSFYKRMGGEKAVYKYRLKEKGLCDHIELRWKDCQTALPPSKHLSGGIYDFSNKEPNERPVTIEASLVARCIERICNTDKEYHEEARVPRQTGYDEEQLESAIEHLSQTLPDGSYDDWIKVGFGLASLGKAGEELFVRMSLNNPNYADSELYLRKKFAGLLADHNGITSPSTVYRVAEMYGWKRPINRFWYIDERDNVKISRTLFKRFLEGEGFCKLRKDGGYLYVRIVNNIVTEINTIFVKDFVQQYLDNLPSEEFEPISKTEVIDALIKGANQFFAHQFFEFLITKEVEFKRDIATESYVYYKNGYLVVTAHRANLCDYKNMDGYIWEKQIIDREYAPTFLRSDFEVFMYNACRGDAQRTRALKSGIGYLLHTYKDPNIAKAVILLDEKKSEGAFGRSGKGLVIRGISQIRTVVTEDGRNFNIGKNFAFQRVNADTNILAIEDMRENFPFDRLFSIITEGITIEKKQKDEIYLKGPESPKIMISSNYTVKGIDDSTRDRQFIVEFSDHYNRRHRPIDEFGKLFFEGWDKSEWEMFDNLMIGCLQLYLREGLVYYSFVNLEEKQLVDETCEEFAEFSSEIKVNHEYCKKEIFEQFKSEYTEFEKLTQGKFTRWLKVWARIREYDVTESKSGAKRTVIFSSMREAA